MNGFAAGLPTLKLLRKNTGANFEQLLRWSFCDQCWLPAVKHFGSFRSCANFPLKFPACSADNWFCDAFVRSQLIYPLSSGYAGYEHDGQAHGAHPLQG
jgi:hypothetical protein